MKRWHFAGLALVAIVGYERIQSWDIPRQVLADGKRLIEKNTPKLKFDPETHFPSKERRP
jgi:hypothetical protein